MHGSLYVCARVYRCNVICMEVYMYVRVLGVYDEVYMYVRVFIGTLYA